MKNNFFCQLSLAQRSLQAHTYFTRLLYGGNIAKLRRQRRGPPWLPLVQGESIEFAWITIIFWCVMDWIYAFLPTVLYEFLNPSSLDRDVIWVRAFEEAIRSSSGWACGCWERIPDPLREQTVQVLDCWAVSHLTFNPSSEAVGIGGSLPLTRPVA